MLSIALLGSPLVELDGAPLEIKRRKSRALLYYLAAHTQPLTREHLLAFFWPDSPRDTAQQTLRTTLHGLRKALGEHIQASPLEIGLGPGVEVDTRRFETVVSNQVERADETALRAALALYRGPFLDEFMLNEPAGFESWQSATQEYYRRLVVRGMTSLARFAENRADLAAAIDAMETALAHDPFQEDAQRSLLRLLYRSGNRVEAIRRYMALVDMLDEELGVPPMPETRALYDDILADRLPGTPAPAPARRAAHLPDVWELPFTGRETELTHIDRGAAQGNLVYLEGEPGAGKTRLVREWIARQQSGALTLSGTARELENVLPYSPFAGVLRGLASAPAWLHARDSLTLDPLWWTAAGRLVPDLAPPDQRPAQRPERPLPGGESQEGLLWEGIARVLEAAAAHFPLIIFLDDLHWSDTATLGLLGYLLRRELAPPGLVTWLAAAQPPNPASGLGKLLASLTREDRLTRILPGRLTAGEIQQISARLSPGYAQALAVWLERSSEGNPYVLSELVRWAEDNQVLLPDGTLNLDRLSDSPVVPGSIYHLAAARLGRLSAEARQVLDTAVAAGREFDPQVVTQASALSEDAALDALDELTGAGLVHPHGMDYRFDHSLIMEVAYREAGESRHRRFHRRFAEALESHHHNQLDTVAGLLASHFSEGLAPKKAAPYALVAAQQAERLAAWGEAAGFYQVALEAEESPAAQARLWLSIFSMRFQAGDHLQAEQAARAALEIARTQRLSQLENQARLALAETLLGQTRLEETIALARETLEQGGAACAQNAEFLWGAALSIQGIDLDQAERHLTRAQDLASRGTGAAAERMQIEFELGNISAQRGDLNGAVARYRQAIALARKSPRLEAFLWQTLALNNLAYHLHLSGDPAARAAALEGLDLAQRKGLLSLQSYLYSTLGEIDLAANQLDQAEENFRQAQRIATRHAVAERVAGSTAGLGRVAAARGQIQSARSLFSSALESAETLRIERLTRQIRAWLEEL